MMVEQQDKIHAFMRRQAEKRMLFKVASQDPEVAALLEGRHVENPIDPEMFLLKKVIFNGVSINGELG